MEKECIATLLCARIPVVDTIADSASLGTKFVAAITPNEMKVALGRETSGVQRSVLYYLRIHACDGT